MNQQFPDRVALLRFVPMSAVQSFVEIGATGFVQYCYGTYIGDETIASRGKIVVALAGMLSCLIRASELYRQRQ